MKFGRNQARSQPIVRVARLAGPELVALPDREELWFVKSALSLRRGGFPMPRASWKGFLRLSLVSCPIYLSPATTRTKSIRLHQVWQPKAGRGAPVEDDEEDEQPSRPAAGSFSEDFDDTRSEPPAPTRVALRPHDPYTGEEIEREEIAKATNTSAAGSSPSRPPSSRRSTWKARRSSTLKPSCRVPRSTRCISATRITSIRMARSRLRRSG